MTHPRVAIFVAVSLSLSVLGACDSNSDEANDTSTVESSDAGDDGSLESESAAPTTMPRSTLPPTVTPPTTDKPTLVLPTVPEEGSVLDIVRSHPDLTRLAGLIDELDQDGVFTQERGVTLFAPNDAAFETLDDDALDADPTAVTLLISEHLSVGTYTLDDLIGGTFSNAMGRNLPVVRDGDVVTVHGIAVVEGDLAASNGVVHIIDGVIAPDEPG